MTGALHTPLDTTNFTTLTSDPAALSELHRIGWADPSGTQTSYSVCGTSGVCVCVGGGGTGRGAVGGCGGGHRRARRRLQPRGRPPASTHAPTHPLNNHSPKRTQLQWTGATRR